LSHKQEIALQQAKKIAGEFISLIQPACEWIEVAGSIRRQKRLVNDIELVVIPKIVPSKRKKKVQHSKKLTSFITIAIDPSLDEILENLVIKRKIQMIKSGDKYKQFIFWKYLLQIDLFIANKTNLGYILLLRTGSADYSQNFVTEVKRRGQFRCGKGTRAGYVWNIKTWEIVPTPTEQALYALVGIPWLDPPKREKHLFPQDLHSRTCVECEAEFKTKYELKPETARCYSCYQLYKEQKEYDS
jgi:DNA polymerase/3'-5' exonuclease PolX